ncbi:hypothetical protein B0H11DRAFT_2109301 [Mycena galericulata]|nr:hypothetical protein B0H11DRAFT_2109301 [Mycena galericulata]
MLWCGICRCKAKNPHAIAICGHAYCIVCLRNYITASSQDRPTATCPECRGTFNLVTPERAVVPEALRQYFVPSLVPLFLNHDDSDEVKEITEKYKSKCEEFEQMKDKLNEAREHVDEVEKYAEDEGNKALQKRLKRKAKYDALKQKYLASQEECQTLRNVVLRSSVDNVAVAQPTPLRPPARPAPRRKRKRRSPRHRLPINAET